jgi:dynein light chain LC8-type
MKFHSDIDENSDMRTEAVCMQLTQPNKVAQITRAGQAIQKLSSEREVASFIKSHFDSKYGPNWHCFVGKHFAHFGSFEAGTYIFFHVGQVAILLYRMN